MPELTITREDLEQLASKLDALAPSLTPEETTLLVSLFQLAGRVIAEKNGQDVAGFLVVIALPTAEGGLNLQGAPLAPGDASGPTPLSRGFMESVSFS